MTSETQPPITKSNPAVDRIGELIGFGASPTLNDVLMVGFYPEDIWVYWKMLRMVLGLSERETLNVLNANGLWYVYKKPPKKEPLSMLRKALNFLGYDLRVYITPLE